jgi:SPP1 gp7 family putative phage head morphogenesis protein
VAEHWAPLLHQALTGAPSGLQKLAAEYLAGPHSADPDAARQWLEHRGLPIAQALAPVLQGLWTDGYWVGAVSSRQVLSHHAVIVKALDQDVLTLGTDWGNWSPGDDLAARELLGAEGLGDGLAALLEHGGIVLKGIEDTKLTQLASVLADGVDKGLGVGQLAANLRSIVDDPKWAYRVALTETTRAVSSATLLRYARNGVDAKEWLTASDQRVCEQCQNNQDMGAIPLDGAFPDGLAAPPAHPTCRCSLAPSWLSANDAANLGADLGGGLPVGLGADEAVAAELGGVLIPAEGDIADGAPDDGNWQWDQPIDITRPTYAGNAAGDYAISSGWRYTVNDITYLVEKSDQVTSEAEARAVAQRLAAIRENLPAALRELQTRYAVTAEKNPFDAMWAEKYQRPVRSVATASGNDVAIWAPEPGAQIDQVLIHEGGHNLSAAADAAGLGADGEAWQAASTGADARATVYDFYPAHDSISPLSLADVVDAPFPSGVTAYGTASRHEDFAESVRLYHAPTLGTGRLSPDGPLQDILFRDLYPARAEVLDRVLAEEHHVGEVAGEAHPMATAQVKDLSGKTVAELRAMAKEAGLKGYSAMKREQLLEALGGKAKAPVKAAPAKAAKAAPAAKKGAPAKKTAPAKVPVEKVPATEVRMVELAGAQRLATVASNVEEQLGAQASERALIHRLRSELKQAGIEPTIGADGVTTGYTLRRSGGAAADNVNIPLEAGSAEKPLHLTGERAADQLATRPLEAEVANARELAGLAMDVERQARAGVPADEIIASIRERMAKLGLKASGRPGERLPFDPAAHKPITGSKPATGATSAVVRPGYAWGNATVLRPTVEEYEPSVAELATARQAEIDAVRPIAEDLVQVEYGLANGMTPAEAVEFFRDSVTGNPAVKKMIAALQKPGTTPAKALAAVRREAAKIGLTPVEKAGAKVTYLPGEHAPLVWSDDMQAAARAHAESGVVRDDLSVIVDRPGYALTRDNGERVVLEKATVAPIDNTTPKTADQQRAEYAAMTLPELKAIAFERDLDVPPRATKAWYVENFVYKVTGPVDDGLDALSQSALATLANASGMNVSFLNPRADLLAGMRERAILSPEKQRALTPAELAAWSNRQREASAKFAEIARQDALDRYEPMFRDIPESLRRDIRDGFPDATRSPVTGGAVGDSERVTMPDGTEYFSKTSHDWFSRTGDESTDAEQLSALMGNAIEAPVLGVARDAEDRIYTDWVDGQVGGRISGPQALQERGRIVNSGPGRRLGLLDTLTANTDRHDANWMVDTQGNLVGIDHGMLWGRATDPSVLALDDDAFRQWVAGSGGNIGRFSEQTFLSRLTPVKVADIPLTQSDLRELRQRLEALRPDFVRLNHENWLDYSLRVLDILEPYIGGTQSIFDDY